MLFLPGCQILFAAKQGGEPQALLLLREYKPCYDALADAVERGRDLGQCIVATEDVAKREKKGWLVSP